MSTLQMVQDSLQVTKQQYSIHQKSSSLARKIGCFSCYLWLCLQWGCVGFRKLLSLWVNSITKPLIYNDTPVMLLCQRRPNSVWSTAWIRGTTMRNVWSTFLACYLQSRGSQMPESQLREYEAEVLRWYDPKMSTTQILQPTQCQLNPDTVIWWTSLRPWFPVLEQRGFTVLWL